MCAIFNIQKRMFHTPFIDTFIIKLNTDFTLASAMFHWVLPSDRELNGFHVTTILFYILQKKMYYCKMFYHIAFLGPYIN